MLKYYLQIVSWHLLHTFANMFVNNWLVMNCETLVRALCYVFPYFYYPLVC